MDNVLLILAAGKSSRFGGFPKAFCKIGDEFLAQKTVNIAKHYYSKIYFVINKDIYREYKNAILGCNTFSIVTGQGDSHSFLRALRKIVNNYKIDKITLCWGDTIYLNPELFDRAAKISKSMKNNIAGVSLCSIDKKPYAWYDVDRDIICKSRFKYTDGIVQKGIHDQSIFIFNCQIIENQLEKYMTFLGLNDEEDYINKKVSKEMKLLNAFTFFYENNMYPMTYEIVDPGFSYSFNTKEELEKIIKFMNEERKCTI